MATQLPLNSRPTGAVWALLAFDGRLGRQPFWLGLIFVNLLGMFLMRPLITANDDGQVEISAAASPISIVLMWSIIALAVKRLHDCGLSGWLVLALFVPILFAATPLFIPLATVAQLAFFGAVGLMPGTPGPNAYAPATNRRPR